MMGILRAVFGNKCINSSNIEINNTKPNKPNKGVTYQGRLLKGHFSPAFIINKNELPSLFSLQPNIRLKKIPYKFKAE